jgi:hypothetical protein
VALELRDRARVDRADRLAELARAAPHEVLGEQPDVAPARSRSGGISSGNTARR